MPNLRRISQDHPRIRGEHYLPKEADIFEGGSSPHTRGARIGDAAPLDGDGIIPAYAGSTYRIGLSGGASQDHPRIRGEHGHLEVAVDPIQGSSPHTRGAHGDTAALAAAPGIIPAYAGSTLGNPCNTKDRRRDYTSFPLPVTHPSGGGGS